ncbi:MULTISPECIES: hypothetical protein [unclassified Streptomyces]|uniref:hypothetical protein n=1 Tax=unclassified Streptomyces TaxID=2593676 RepID=UPI001927CB47|nr:MULTISPECIES: hypothetical protein [unclassified Streptomyces]MCW5252429.1 hypothetical protein [Streptomyces sp. SHP 1-2]
MFEYELHQYRYDELIRRADRARLVREAVRARRGAPGKAGGAESHDTGPRGSRSPRAA